MNYGNVPGIDKPIARLVQGTVMVRSDRQAQSFQLLDDVFDLGGTTFDTAHGLVPFAVSSPNFSLAIQVKEPWENCVSLTGPGMAEARRYYQEIRLPLFTWSSLAGGFFSGRFRPDNLDTFTEYLDKLCVDSYCYPQRGADCIGVCAEPTL